MRPDRSLVTLAFIILTTEIDGGMGAFLGIGGSNQIYKDPKLAYFAHSQLGDTLGTDISVKEETVREVSEEGNSTTNYIKITNSIQIPETESIKLIMEVLRVIWEAIMTGLTKGFMPTIERFRRDTSSSKGSRMKVFTHRHTSQISGFLLDWILDILGAVIGRQECSQRVACRTGRLAQEKVPGSQMVVVMMESFVPPSLLHWFSILKTGVMSSFYSCDTAFACDFNSID